MKYLYQGILPENGEIVIFMDHNCQAYANDNNLQSCKLRFKNFEAISFIITLKKYRRLSALFSDSQQKYNEMHFYIQDSIIYYF